MSDELLAAEQLSKAFGHVQALREVSFDIRRGEVLALVGDNGAGKSTLVKILSGEYQPDAGQLLVRGTQQRFHSPMDATRAGVATVYQDLALVDGRDVAQNLLLGAEFSRGPFVKRRRCYEEAQRIITELGVKLPSVRVPVSMLSGGQRQAVAVARTFVHAADIVILDEPTAALGVRESARVLDLVRRLRDDDKGVLLVSHNLQQIWDLADRFMVLRLGELAGIRARAESTVAEVVQLIVYGSLAPDTAEMRLCARWYCVTSVTWPSKTALTRCPGRVRWWWP